MNDILKSVADNPELTKALRELFLEQFSEDGVSTNLDNESLGQITRARLEGIKRVEQAFRQIETLKSVKEESEKDNPGR